MMIPVKMTSSEFVVLLKGRDRQMERVIRGSRGRRHLLDL